MQIKNTCSSSYYVKEYFPVHFINEIEIKNLIQGLSSKKTTGIDTISQTDKMAVDFLTRPLTKSVNSSIEHNIVHTLAKMALVVPLDKGKLHKIDISNFRPVSILNTFQTFMRDS